MAKRAVLTVGEYNDGLTSIPLVQLTGNIIAAGATKQLAASDNLATVKLDTAGGSTVTLPAATGSGVKYLFVVSALATTVAHVVQTVTSRADFIVGSLVLSNANSTASIFNGIATSSNTITLNRTTTGSVTIGESFEIEDLASNLWFVRGNLTSSSTPVTPFSNVAH